MKRIILLLFVFTLLLAWSCDKKDDKPIEYKVEVINPTSKEFKVDSHKSTQTIIFNATNKWTASATVDWLKLSTKEGESGDKIELKFDVEANDSYDGRTGSISLKCGSIKSETINVVQSQHNELTINKDTFEANPEGDFLTIKVGHNVKYEVEISESWLRITPNTKSFIEEELSFEIDKNDSGADRTGTIKIISPEDENLSKSITVSQVKIVEEDPASLYRKILEKLYSDTGGESWNYKTNWLSDEPVEKWYGISLIDGKLNISLPENGLSGTIDISNCDFIGSLKVQGNNITELIANNCANLKELWIYNNKLNALDVSSCAILNNVYCYENSNLKSVNVSGCSALESLYFYSSPVTEFKHEGCLNLVTVDAYATALKSLDLTGCSKLKKLVCLESIEKSLSKIVLDGCVSLEEVNCLKNNLTSLDVSTCTSLKNLYTEENNLESLILQGCNSLQVVYLSENSKLTELDASELSNLKELHADYCSGLKNLDLHGCSLLSMVNCSSCSLNELNIEGCKALMTLTCSYNKLSSIVLKDNPDLYILNCESNKLSELIIENSPSLSTLSCWQNKLTSLNLKSAKSLSKLTCYSNSLSSLDVSGLTELRELYCHTNKLEELNVEGCISIYKLYCYNNPKLKTFKLDDLENSLSNFKCEDTFITMEVPGWFKKLRNFRHDARYTYSESGEVTDNGHGWWYPGEPESGKHAK